MKDIETDHRQGKGDGMHKHKPHIYTTFPGTCAGRKSDGKLCHRNLGFGGIGSHVIRHFIELKDGLPAMDTMTLFCLDHCPICAEERGRKDRAAHG